LAEHRSTTPASDPSSQADLAAHDDIIYPPSIPFVLIHVACLAAIWSGVTTTALMLCVALYIVRMFGVTAGYHRYFSHRSYKTSRVVQFLLAFLAQSSAQRGILWWAAKHRHHHKHSDTAIDVHSPRQAGFWYAHVGWIFTPQHGETDLDAVPDLTKYPELVWLDRNPYFPATILGAACLLLGGWAGLVVGFVWSTVLLYHGTFFINSLAHVHGTQRYVTGDDSRNNWWLAVITLGEGWHNNHHTYQRSTRQGFRWYEFDPTFYVLKTLSWARVVWDLGKPPTDVIRNERPLGRALLEKVAHQLAMSFPLDQIEARARDAWAQTPTLQELRQRVADGHARAEELIAELHLPHLPSVAELRHRAEQMFASTPSTDAIVARAREIILQGVSLHLLSIPERS
jgi:stearoyl-CoA desaturase (delta-9 desaturase)